MSETFTFHMRKFARCVLRPFIPSPLRGGVGGGGTMRTELSLYPPSPTLPRKGGGRRN